MKSFLTLSAFCLLISCQNSSTESNALQQLSDSTSVTGLTGDSVKLVKTAGINFKVKDVEQGTRAVSRLAQQFGGMVFSQQLASVEGDRNELKISQDSLLVVTTVTPQASLTARIPSHHLEKFMYSVADLGYHTGSSHLQIEDKSLVYLQNALKQKNRTDVLIRTSAKGNKPASTLRTIAVQDEIVEQQIANKAIDADVNYSTVNLSLSQNSWVRKEVIANYNISDYQLSFGVQFSNAFREGWQYFLNFVLALAHFWMFFLVALAVYIAYKLLPAKRKLFGIGVKP